jgi:hypothetical protein
MWISIDGIPDGDGPSRMRVEDEYIWMRVLVFDEIGYTVLEVSPVLVFSAFYCRGVPGMTFLPTATHMGVG